MEHLIKGLHRFQTEVFAERRAIFEQLAAGQNPEVLFITCSDSRIDPALLTQTQPGELFIMRNAGNLVPPYGSSNGGEAATIEYAVAALGVRNIVVCGHSYCGAMKGVLDPGSLDDLPAVRSWLSHAEGTRRIIRESYAEYAPAAKLAATVEENVLVQIDNLRSHPTVAAALAARRIALHAWVYEIESGEIYAYDQAVEDFVDLTPETHAPRPPRPRPGERGI